MHRHLRHDHPVAVGSEVIYLIEGSHSMGVEKNRLHLVREVQSFLEEPSEP